jgi:hypothetical protein
MCASDFADQATSRAIGDRLKDGTSGRLMRQDEESSSRDTGVKGRDAAGAAAEEGADDHEYDSAGDCDDR